MLITVITGIGVPHISISGHITGTIIIGTIIIFMEDRSIITQMPDHIRLFKM
ncbi:MAG TPA: hypothetical protein VNW49_08435 [Puia sp.]|nr:hypothetical protein [Puia sp.]